MSFTRCPHPAKRRTLIGDTLLCAKCARPHTAPTFCETCGRKKEDLRRGERIRWVEKHTYCDPCRLELRHG